MPDDSPTGYGRLARQIADWTAKGLFSALVLVAGLGFGRQVVHWWHRDDGPFPATSDPVTSPFDFIDRGEPVEISLGDSPYRLGRQTVVGDHAEARRVLRDACRRLLPTASAWSPVADEHEQRLLERLAKDNASRDAADLPTDCELHEPAPGMPLVVGTRRLGGSPAIEPARRVVLWGLAMPAAERQWTLCLFQAGGAQLPDEPNSSLPLPPGGQRIMNIGRGGAEVTAFQGAGTCDDDQRFYTAWHTEHRPRESLRWQRTGDGGWYGCVPRRAAEASNAPARSLVIQLVPGRAGGCTGLIFGSP